MTTAQEHPDTVPGGEDTAPQPTSRIQTQGAGKGQGVQRLAKNVHSSSATASKESLIERNRPPGIRIPKGRLLTPEENPPEKRARLSRPIHERLGPLPGANPSPMNTDASNPIQATDRANPRSYKLRNRVASPGESNDTITIPSS